MPQETDKTTVRSRAQRIGLAAGLIVFIGMIAAPAPTGLTDAGWGVAALTILMAIWWMTEALPLAATALAPIVVLPLLGVQPLEAVAPSYAHPLIFLFLGGFLIAKALERWGLHRRIAAVIIHMGPKGPAGLIASLMVATAFLSMWISNTATAMVMVPIAQSIVYSIRRDNTQVRNNGDFAAALMLSIAFSATVGGMATLIGTPPNALLAGYLQAAHGIKIGFAQWMIMGIPIVIVLLPVVWLVLTRGVFNLSKYGGLAFERMTDEAQPELWQLPAGAKLTAAITAFAGLALIFRPLLEMLLPGLPLSDAGIFMTAALVLFATPACSEDRGMLLRWQDAKTIRWDVLILFGGGLGLATAIEGSGLSQAVGSAFSSLQFLPMSLVVLLAMAAIVYLGELASNTAMAAVFLPVAGAVAIGIGGVPLDLVIPVGLAASLGFMLPVATPPNAIVFGSGAVTSQQMLKAGAILDVVAILIVYVMVLILAPVVFSNL